MKGANKIKNISPVSKQWLRLFICTSTSFEYVNLSAFYVGPNEMLYLAFFGEITIFDGIVFGHTPFMRCYFKTVSTSIVHDFYLNYAYILQL